MKRVIAGRSRCTKRALPASVAALAACAIVLFVAPVLQADRRPPREHRNFRVAVYIPVGVVEQMKDRQWLENSWNTISRQIRVDKVYVESYRSGVLASGALLERVKKFFLHHGVQVAGGIAFTARESRQFQTICYTDARERAFVKQVSELTARHFNEIILDDFFFNMTKTDSDIRAKGKQSWTQFRLNLMDEVARDLVVEPAKAVNPKVRVIIKFPNWYEHFEGLGYDLDQEPHIFDGIYTGTETRDPDITDQHLQPYESYEIFRYFEKVKPGGNGGGWVDTFSIRYIDRYAEQLWDTLLAKAPEIMLFNWDALLQPAQPGNRQAWQDLRTSFDYAQMAARESGGARQPATMAGVAGYALDQIDPLIGQLGNPIGIASYRPDRSTGEDFLHNYLGMMAIPIDLRPEFPAKANPILLTASAQFDRKIVSEIQTQLRQGKDVVITSGLLRALENRGIDDIVELRATNHIEAIRGFAAGFGAGNGTEWGAELKHDVFIPEIRFFTNDAWALVRGTALGNGFPLLLVDHYSKGSLYVLTVPENFNSLYEFPPPVLAAMRSYIMGDFPVRLDAPSRVSLFAYDNHTFVVENFRDQAVNATVAVTGAFTKLKNLATEEVTAAEPAPPAAAQRTIPGPARTGFRITVEPHSYAAFRETN